MLWLKCYTYLSVLVLVLVEELLSDILLPERPDGGQTLQSDGEVRVDWAAS